MMKNKTSILLITLLALSGMMVLATSPATAQESVTISAINGQNAYDDTTVYLQPNTEYTITFTNPDAITGHNLRIDVDQDIGTDGITDSDDITIGVENDASGATDGTWTGTWTTPASGEYTFYCGFSGHYSAGMEGTFIIGDPPSDDENGLGFGAFAGIAALLIAGLAIPTLRKQ